jgi:hypothetical protein
LRKSSETIAPHFLIRRLLSSSLVTLPTAAADRAACVKPLGQQYSS